MSGFEHVFDADPLSSAADEAALLADSGADLFDSLLHELDEEVLFPHDALSQHEPLAEHAALAQSESGAPTQLFGSYAGVPISPADDAQSLSSADNDRASAHSTRSHKRKAASAPYPSHTPHTVPHNATHTTPHTVQLTQSPPIQLIAPLTQCALTTQPTRSDYSLSAYTQSADAPQSSSARDAHSALTQWPVALFQAFNGGDVKGMRALVAARCAEHCALRTAALDEALGGRHWVSALFEALGDAHPDGVLVAKHCALDEEARAVRCRVYFAGTRVAPLFPSVSPSQSLSVSPSVATTHNEFLFRRPQSSLLSAMDPRAARALSRGEVAAMEELERRAAHLAVFCKGTLSLSLDAALAQFECVDLQLEVSSFRDADFLC